MHSISTPDRLGMCEALAKFFANNEDYMKSPVMYNPGNTNAHIHAFETFWAQQSDDEILDCYVRLPKIDIQKSRVSEEIKNLVLTNRVKVAH